MTLPTAKVRFDGRYRRTAADCWEWTGSTRGPMGYGQFWYKGASQHAHRVAWELYRGVVPGGACVLHRCDNPICVNPDHLFLGTVADNNRDRAVKNRSFRKRGALCTTAKLTDEIVAGIRALPSLRGQYARLVAKYGVSERHLRKVHRGERWLAKQ